MRPDRATITAKARDANRARARRHRAAPVVALTEATAAIQSSTGALAIYRRYNKPALGPEGDSLDGLEPPVGGSAVRRLL